MFIFMTAARPDHEPLRSAAAPGVGPRERAGCWGLASALFLLTAALCFATGAIFRNGADGWSPYFGILGALLGVPALLRPR